MLMAGGGGEEGGGQAVRRRARLGMPVCLCLQKATCGSLALFA